MGQAMHPDTYCRGIDEDEIHEIGEQWREEGVCHMKVCQEQGIVSTHECATLPEVLPDPRCRIEPQNLAERFPACCAKLVCPPLEDVLPEEIEETEWDEIWDKYRAERLMEFTTEDDPEGFPLYDSDDYVHINCPYVSESESD